MMLDDLELLDDTTPPDADAAILARVRGRAGRRRRRNRVAAAGAVVASLAVAFGTVAVVRNHHQTLDVTPTATTATTAPKQVSKAVALPNGFQARLNVENPTVVLGDSIRARVELRNGTAVALGLPGAPIQCVLGGRPVLRDAAGKLVAQADGNVGHGCGIGMSVVTPGNSTSVAFTLSTDAILIPQDSRSAGYNLFLFVEPISATRTTWRLGPVPVEVVAPDLTAHVELPKTTFTAGGEAKGTLVVDNPSRAAVLYTIDCNGEPPYHLMLAHDGATLPVSFAGNGCVDTFQPQYGIGPGTHRFPFTVGIDYSGCVDGQPTVDEPRCTPDGTPPPLPPDDYQIVFSGTGPFGSLRVSPVTIHVVAASKVVNALRRRG